MSDIIAYLFDFDKVIIKLHLDFYSGIKDKDITTWGNGSHIYNQSKEFRVHKDGFSLIPSKIWWQ